MGRRNKRTWAESRGLCALHVAGLVVALGVVASVARAQGPADPNKTLKAVQEARKIWKEARQYDRENGGVYPAEFVQKVVSFYERGTLEESKTGDPIVTQKFCRDYVLGLLRELFLAKRVGSNEPDPKQEYLTNILDEGSAQLFREALGDILLTAHSDLSFIQRTRLYNLSGEVFSPQDTNAIETLQMLAGEPEPELGGGEQSLILRTVERIESRAVPEPPS